ncbi:hypothetical protein FAGAP_5335 [Fusarium agapanthi]|uniref:F-box domain-containing protein n=1 Tax=Fusarium agapanthi TaxID=1803897 RepID=A0A9P5ED61_9HYPO|nr:hypothetical protein FAGAP_5335 [Fusarium agapanthi]
MATATRVHHLPPETLGNVISFLPQADIKNLRLVNHRFSPLATRRLFRRTRLLARAKDNNDPQRFIQLAKSKLSGFVREVSCDVSSIVYNGLYYMEEEQFEFLPVFWDALPLLARFRNIQTLHLCFDASFALQDFKEDSSQFRRLTNMPEFKTAMENIKALRLDIAQHKERWGGAWSFTETTAIPNQCQEMFTQLPLTWLSSTVAANLQVLSLHYQSYWGWFPNIDIRLVGGGNGMPKLRSLALGHFVFSHQREVDWITSLDLEELFLEGCAVLTKHIGHPTIQKGLWTDGHELTATTKIDGEEERICLWWHEIIWQIRTSMLNLKRFCIVGQPDLTYHYRQFREIESLRDPELSSDEELSHELSLWKQYVIFSKKNIRSCETAFQHFTCATSPKLRLDSDIFRCSHFDPLTSIILDSSGYNYVSHGPTYTEQASYKKDFRNAEAGPVIRSMEKLAKAEVIILHSMLSKKSKKQHMGAEKLRLAPKMESRDTNEYIEAVLHPLFTYRELSHLKVMLKL